MTPDSMPTQLGRYKLLRLLGKGGMGAVYVARDTRLNREVALKLPLVKAQTNPITVERFHREAGLAASIDHPNFCPVYDVGEDHGHHYYVMPIIPGKPLTEHLRAGEPWPLDRAASLIAALASALAELHQRGVVHRDLKPANIMLKPDGSVVLMDFGLAKAIESTGEGLTGSGEVMGTPSYMAPEQASSDGVKVGPAADVWALGVLLYQLVAGRLPFTGMGIEVLGRILYLEPRPPSEHRPDKDTRLDAVCMQALSKEVEKRPNSMTAFAAMLRDVFRPVSPASGAVERITCPHCGKRGRAPVDRLGKRLKCPSCGKFLDEPASPSVEPAPTPVAQGRRTMGLPGSPFTNSVGMEFLWIPAGTFLMGSPDSDADAYADEKPQHSVRIERGLWMAAKEVTRGQYKQFVEETGHAETAWQTVFEGETDEHPVVKVSWDDAIKFCEWLSKKEGITYDLPTEAEWEYCCRAGTTTKYSFGDDAAKLGQYAWHEDNAEQTTHPVGQLEPNPWGLYDMHGNVWEWCKDNKRKYTKEGYADKLSAYSGKGRVVRGGSWSDQLGSCRCANRLGVEAGDRDPLSGFRIVVLSSPRTP